MAYIHTFVEPIYPIADGSVGESLHRDDSLLHRSSIVNGSASTTTAQYVRVVQILIMNLDNADGSRRADGQATVLCRMVDRSAYSSEELSAANEGWRQPMAAVWTIVFLSTLMIMRP
jgi:hypothetical protein